MRWGFSASQVSKFPSLRERTIGKEGHGGQSQHVSAALECRPLCKWQATPNDGISFVRPQSVTPDTSRQVLLFDAFCEIDRILRVGFRMV